VTARSLFLCSCLLLLGNIAYAGGIYQRTRDGKTLVWNNYPRPGDEATWSGKRDTNGYATGPGTLTWFAIVTASSGPDSSKRRTAEIGRYTGNMIRGKFDGLVVNVEPNGKTFHLTFVNGSRVSSPSVTPAPARDQQHTQTVDRKRAVQAPAEGPSPSPEQKRNKLPSGGVIVEAPTRGNASGEEVSASPPESMTTAELSQPRRTPSGAPSAELDPAVKDRIAQLKEQIESVLAQVGEATGNFHEIDRLDSVQNLPPPVSQNIDAVVGSTRDLTSNLGSETAQRECGTEAETAEGLAVVDQVARAIATNDAGEASSKLADFFKNNPEPVTDNQKLLWGYLTSIQSLCGRLKKEAEVHLQRAESLAAASRTSEAIQEYQEAYRTFPNPATAAKIRQLQDSSLGL
jgi:hypothetical protein